MHRTNDLGRDKIFPLVCRLAIPTMLAQMVSVLYSIVDRMYIGNIAAIGDLALAGVGVCGPITTLLSSFASLVGLGGAPILAMRLGEGRPKEAQKVVSNGFLMLVVLAAVLTALFLLLKDEMLMLFGASDNTFGYADTYLTIYTSGTIFALLATGLNSYLIAQGYAGLGMLSVIIGAVLNIVLDPVFIFLLHMDVAGAAIATVIAQAAMTVFLTGYGIIKYPILRFRPGRQSFDRTTLAWGCRFGIPPMLQSSVSSVGSLILQNFMNGFGTQTVAAITTAYRVDSIVMVPILNLGSGISTLVAQNCGAGQNLRARSIFRVGTAVMAAVSLLLTVLVIPTGGELIALFGAGPEAVSIGDAFFRRIACFYVVYGLANAVRSYLEGMGDVVYSSLAGMASLVCRIVLSYTLVVFFANMVIAWAEALSWVLLLLLYVVRAVWKERQWKSEGIFQA